MELANTQKEIINHLIALHESSAYTSKLSPYFRAFGGDFSPDMPFTFYFASETHPVMYIYDPLPGNLRSSRAVFQAECDQKKAKILEIGRFIANLVEDNYLDIKYKGLQGRAELPENYDRVWRKYGNFYNDVMLGLSYVCLSDFIPTQRLYHLQQELIKNNKVLYHT
jgi:hypothetical protein